LSPIYKRDFLRGGRIELDGRPVRYRVPRPALKDGIVYVTEDRKTEGIFETMSVAENLYAGLLAAGLERLPIVSLREMRALAAEWSDTLQIRAIASGARAVELSGGNQQKVVIGKGLIERPRLIVLDEPTRGVDVGAITGDSSSHQPARGRRSRGAGILLLPARDPVHLRSHSGLPSGAHCGRALRAEASEERIMYAAVH
jgi:simple sugar transport system ATP-binding protein